MPIPKQPYHLPQYLGFLLALCLGVGTSPVAAQTGVPDSHNTIYDDIDLDGDGMVGRIEKALQTNPLTPDNPFTFTEINEIQPGVFTFKVPVNYGLIESIGELNLNVNGVDATLEKCISSADGKSLLVWNTLFDAPRQNYLQPQLMLHATGEEGSTLRAAGPLYPFYSDNVLQFSEASAMFDETGAYLDADLPEANATYNIQLYDPSTDALIASIGPKSTSDGTIREDWDLNGYTGDGIRAVFTVTLLDAAGVPTQTGTGKRTLAKVSGREGGKNFDFAFFYTPRDTSRLSAFDRNGNVWNYMLGVVDTLMAPRWGYPVYESSFNEFSGRDWQPEPGYLKSRSDVTDRLLPNMKEDQTRQVYFHGHGSPTRMSAKDENVVYIEAKEVADKLENKYFPTGAYELDAKRPYRFVFLDGCNTQTTKNWRRAFGILSSGISRDKRGKIGPQAFVGWDGEIVSLLAWKASEQYADLLCECYSDTLAIFYTDWMMGIPLVECIKYASNPKNSGIEMPLPVPANAKDKDKTKWYIYKNGIPLEVLGYKFTSPIKVSGHPGLTLTGCRHELDNSSMLGF